MSQDSTLVKSYRFPPIVCYGASVVERHLCRGSTLSFIAALLLIGATGLSGYAAFVSYVAGGAEDVVYRRAAVIKASAPVHAAGWER